MTWEAPALRTMCRCKEGGDKCWVGSLSNDHDIANVNENGKKARLKQPRPQGSSLKKWVGREKALASAGHVSPRTPIF